MRVKTPLRVVAVKKFTRLITWGGAVAAIICTVAAFIGLVLAILFLDWRFVLLYATAAVVFFLVARSRVLELRRMRSDGRPTLVSES